MPCIDVLLATYNGAKYLEEQIESLLGQTFTDFRIIARDDGSTDNTLAILTRYSEKYGNKFWIISDEQPSGSAQGNFARLTDLSDADYTMYCDQDDYWHPGKIEMTYAAMRKAEESNREVPVLVHCDLQVVDSDRNVMSRSFWAYQGLNPHMAETNHLVVQSNITGCTVMINRVLREKAQPFPNTMIMHDWWLGLIAAISGRIVAIDTPLIDYRQHETNDTGAKHFNFRYVAGRVIKQLTTEMLSESRRTIRRTQNQADALVRHVENALSKHDIVLLDQYIHMDEMNFIQRRYFVIRNGFMKQGFVRNLAYLVVI